MDSPTSPPAMTLTATCACKTFKRCLSIPTSSLPHERALCLCSSCRQVSGSVGITYLAIPHTTIDPSSFSLTAYPTSKRVTRYICSTCGAHTCAYIHDQGSWTLATGLLDRTEGILRWTGCKYMDSTIDGGVGVWLNSITDADGTKRELQKWTEQDGTEGGIVPADALPKHTPPPPPKSDQEFGEEKLKASCHCGGVKFHITRPNAASKAARSPFPDLMIPFHTGASAANPSNEPW